MVESSADSAVFFLASFRIGTDGVGVAGQVPLALVHVPAERPVRLQTAPNVHGSS